MTERAGIGIKKDYNLLNWEQNEFPILCQNCMGDSKFLRMLKKPLGAECRICTRPFTVFKWNTKAENTRQRRTETCSTCAKINNSCQSCAHDLQFNLPIELRNKLLGDNKIELLMSEGNKDIFAHLANDQIDKLQLPYEKLDQYLKANQQGLTNISKMSDLPKETDESEILIDSTNIRKFVYDRYHNLDHEQKAIVKALDEAELIVNKHGHDKEIEIKFVMDDELKIIENKIRSIFDEVPFKLHYENKRLSCEFEETEEAEKFLKIFGDGFVIRGKKLTVGWKNDQEEGLGKNFYGVVTDEFLPPPPEEPIEDKNLLVKRDQMSS